MAHEQLEIIESPEDLSIRVRSLDSTLLLANVGGGFMDFADAAFPDASRDKVFAKQCDREPRGQGAHFDVYSYRLDQDYPWLAVYNFSGSAAVKAALLPENMAKDYDEEYKEANEEAHIARRKISATVLESPDTTIGEGRLEPSQGFVLSQKAYRNYIIHEVVPDDPENPGQFVKLIVPGKDQRNFFVDKGFIRFGDFIEEKICDGMENTKRAQATQPNVFQNPFNPPRPHRPQEGGVLPAPSLNLLDGLAT